MPGVLGNVLAAAAWDPDGAGPMTPRLVVGGDFLYAGTIRVNRLAAYDPATGQWSAFASGFDGPVNAIVASPNGDLFVGGTFGGAFGAPGTASVARWNGAAWSGLGGGLGGWCNDLAQLANGDIVATGTFSTAGGASASCIAQWNGAAWSPLGSGLGGSFPTGKDLAVTTSGDVVVAGSFTSAGGVAASNLARWNGSTWSAIPNFFSTLGEVAAAPNDQLLLIVDGGVLHRWDGANWGTVPFNTSVPQVASLTTMANGDVVIGGRFASVTGVAAVNLARWNGAAWSAVADNTTPERATVVTELPAGATYVGGSFLSAGSMVARSIARWQGGTWQALGSGVPCGIVAMAVDGAGKTLALANPTPAYLTQLLRREGSVWQSVGAPFVDLQRAVAVRTNGEVLVGGTASFQGGWRPLWRWNGSAFAPIGVFLGSSIPYVQCLLPLPDGSVLVGGGFESIDGIPFRNLARWDGTSWSALGGTFSSGSSVTALARLANGDVVAGGSFSSVAGVPATNIARWNGTSWSNLGAGIPGFQSILAMVGTPDGGLVVGGSFTQGGGSPGNGIARWNGSTWSPLGSGVDGMVRALAVLPDGDVVLGGTFVHADGVTVRGVARWNGSSFSAFASGITGGTVPGGPADVKALAFQPDGELAVGGEFTEVNFAVWPNCARLRSPCQATATTFGSGCPSSGGSNTLTSQLPWVEGTLRSTGTGLPASALVVTLTSASALPQGALPILSLFPQGGPGCDVLVAPDIVSFLLAANGTAQFEIFVPDSPPLVGVIFYHQMIPIEFDLAGDWVAITATNSVQLTVGRF